MILSIDIHTKPFSISHVSSDDSDIQLVTSVLRKTIKQHPAFCENGLLVTISDTRHDK